MKRQETIEQKLSVLKPQYLEIINNSYNSSPANGESHFTIKILADSLCPHPLLAQHKIIKNLLKEEFSRGLHALSIIIVK
jgi:stress-induced morphogen